MNIRHSLTMNLLGTGNNVDLHINTSKPGVIIPEHLAGYPDLCLCIGLNMTIPIPDLEVNEHGISGTLSFNRVGKFVVVPWDALWAVTETNNNANGCVFEPPPVGNAKPAKDEKPKSVPKSKGHLRLVSSR